MQYTQVKNPKWATEDHSSIECDVVFPSISNEFVPFCANPNDLYDYSKDIFQRCLSGEFGPISEYSAPVYDVAPEGSVLIKQPSVDGVQTL